MGDAALHKGHELDTFSVDPRPCHFVSDSNIYTRFWGTSYEESIYLSIYFEAMMIDARIGCHENSIYVQFKLVYMQSVRRIQKKMRSIVQ